MTFKKYICQSERDKQRPSGRARERERYEGKGGVAWYDGGGGYLRDRRYGTARKIFLIYNAHSVKRCAHDKTEFIKEKPPATPLPVGKDFNWAGNLFRNTQFLMAAEGA